jgi:hypothetical protein
MSRSPNPRFYILIRQGNKGWSYSLCSFLHSTLTSRSQGSSLNIAIDLWTRRLEFDSRKGQVLFLFATAIIPVLGTIQPPITTVPGVLSAGVKRPGPKTDPPSSAEVKNAWSYTSTPPYVFSDNFYRFTVTSSFLGVDFLLSTLFWNTLTCRWLYLIFWTQMQIQFGSKEMIIVSEDVRLHLSDF